MLHPRDPILNECETYSTRPAAQELLADTTRTIEECRLAIEKAKRSLGENNLSSDRTRIQICSDDQIVYRLEKDILESKMRIEQKRIHWNECRVRLREYLRLPSTFDSEN